MSLLWVVYGQTIELQPAHGRWRFWTQVGRDELPESRDFSDLIPFRRGRLHRPSTADRRMLEVRGYIQEATLAAFRATTDTIKGLLDPETGVQGLLVDTVEDGSQRWIRAVPRNLISAYGGNATRLLSIELESLDPFWYGPLGFATLDAGLFLDDGEYLDEGAWIVVTPTTTAHTVLLDTHGTADVERIRLTLTGPSSAAPGFEVDTPDGIVGFTLGAPLTAGQIVDFDNYARTVVMAGVSVRATMTLRAANRHGEYARLLPGANTARVIGKPAQAQILFTPTYL